MKLPKKRLRFFVHMLFIDQNSRHFDFVDAPMLREEAKRWREFRLEVSRSYLLPRKQTG